MGWGWGEVGAGAGVGVRDLHGCGVPGIGYVDQTLLNDTIPGPRPSIIPTLSTPPPPPPPISIYLSIYIKNLSTNYTYIRNNVDIYYVYVNVSTVQYIYV